MDFFFFQIAYASHGNWEPERGVEWFACLARRQLTAQLDIVEHADPPCLAACHFGIVSAIESLFNLSLSLSKGSRPAIRSAISSRGQTGYFSDRARAGEQFLMNAFDTGKEFSDRFF